MRTYVALENVARRLNATKEELLQLNALGWISVIPRNGALFLEGCDEYKTRFILHLQRSLHLSDEQVAKVLFAQEPPYNIEDVDKILSEAVVLEGKP